MYTNVDKDNNKSKKRISPSLVACIGTIMIIIGGFFLSYNYIMSKKVMVYDYMSNVFYSKNEENIKEEEENIHNGDEGIPEQEMDPNKYIGYLEIPKLNFSKGFYPKESSLNDVDKNLLVVKESDYPNVAKGNLIIAGHSGTAWNSFFNDLYKLAVDDELKIKYNEKVYTYKIVNIYKVDKIGHIAVYRNQNRTTLTLVTCTNNDSKTQTIYISELESIE